MGRSPDIRGRRARGADVPEDMRATFNWGIGFAAVVEPAAAEFAIELLKEQGIDAWVIGEVEPTAARWRALRRGVSGRVAVLVSGVGTNLRALRAFEKRGLLGGEIGLVLADRPCDALGFATDEGIPTALVDPSVSDDRDAWDAAVCDALVLAKVDWVVLAGFMRVLGPRTLQRFARPDTQRPSQPAAGLPGLASSARHTRSGCARDRRDRAFRRRDARRRSDRGPAAGHR